VTASESAQGWSAPDVAEIPARREERVPAGRGHRTPRRLIIRIWLLTYVGKYHGRIGAANIIGGRREADYSAGPRVEFTHPRLPQRGIPTAR
jgi:hypothetical protein